MKSRIKCSFAKYLSFDKIAPNSFAEILDDHVIFLVFPHLVFWLRCSPRPLVSPFVGCSYLISGSCVFTRFFHKLDKPNVSLISRMHIYFPS